MISWHGKGPDHYKARIGAQLVEAMRIDSAWCTLVGNRVRVGLSTLDAAMDAGVEMARDADGERNRAPAVSGVTQTKRR